MPQQNKTLFGDQGKMMVNNPFISPYVLVALGGWVGAFWFSVKTGAKKLTEQQTNKQTNKQTSKQADKQANKQTP